MPKGGVCTTMQAPPYYYDASCYALKTHTIRRNKVTLSIGRENQLFSSI